MHTKRYTERMSFMIPGDEKRLLIDEARRRGVSLSELIRRATADLSR